jgi:hypothetical protein
MLHDIGDMNCDFILNVLDIVLMANMVLDNGYMEYTDVNCDSFLNILDLVILVDWVLNGPPLTGYPLSFNDYEDLVVIEPFSLTNTPITFSFDIALISGQEAYMYRQYAGGHISLKYSYDNYGNTIIRLGTWQGGPWDNLIVTEDMVAGGFDSDYHNITAILNPEGNSKIFYDYVLVAEGFLNNPQEPWNNFNGFGWGSDGEFRMKSASIWYGSVISDYDIMQNAHNLVNIIPPTNSWDFTNQYTEILYDIFGDKDGTIDGATWQQLTEQEECYLTNNRLKH